MAAVSFLAWSPSKFERDARLTFSEEGRGFLHPEATDAGELKITCVMAGMQVQQGAAGVGDEEAESINW